MWRCWGPLVALVCCVPSRPWHMVDPAPWSHHRVLAVDQGQASSDSGHALFPPTAVGGGTLMHRYSTGLSSQLRGLRARVAATRGRRPWRMRSAWLGRRGCASASLLAHSCAPHGAAGSTATGPRARRRSARAQAGASSCGQRARRRKMHRATWGPMRTGIRPAPRRPASGCAPRRSCGCGGTRRPSTPLPSSRRFPSWRRSRSPPDTRPRARARRAASPLCAAEPPADPARRSGGAACAGGVGGCHSGTLICLRTSNPTGKSVDV